jgi:hypothetical protein
MKKKNKYSAVRTLYNGEWYDSKKEARYAAQLELLKHAMYAKDRVVKVERQPVYELVQKPNRMTYRADFRVTYADGRVEVVDVKGVKTPVFKLKLKLMKALYPDIVIRLS